MTCLFRQYIADNGKYLPQMKDVYKGLEPEGIILYGYLSSICVLLVKYFYNRLGSIWKIKFPIPAKNCRIP